MAETKKKSLFQKINDIQKEVPHMRKEGTNSLQGYNYLSETQIAELFKKLLEEHGVLFLYSSSVTGVRLSPTGKQLVTDVEVQYKFVDVDSGQEIVGRAAGQGSDATDKGVYKGITGAIKYVFMKTFLIPTGDDPENDSKGGAKQAVHPYDAGKLPFGNEED